MPEFTLRPEYRALIGALKQARLASGLTQIDLARRLKVTPSLVSRVERSERRINAIEFAKLCYAMGADPGRLLLQVMPPPRRPRKAGRHTGTKQKTGAPPTGGTPKR